VQSGPEPAWAFVADPRQARNRELVSLCFLLAASIQARCAHFVHARSGTCMARLAVRHLAERLLTCMALASWPSAGWHDRCFAECRHHSGARKNR
jgi:hypothetical protein